MTDEDADYDYFMKFIETVTNMTLNDFHVFYDYEDNERLANIDLRELVEFVIDKIFISLLHYVDLTHVGNVIRFIHRTITLYAHPIGMLSMMCMWY